MKVRYTTPAALELEASILYLLEHAPSVVVSFSDSIDNAVAELLSVASTCVDFGIPSSTQLMATRL